MSPNMNPHHDMVTTKKAVSFMTALCKEVQHFMYDRCFLELVTISAFECENPAHPDERVWS